MTFDALKDLVRRLAWPSGESENLVAVHDAFFVEAMYDIQKAVSCYQFSNTDTFPHCATYFNCGMTVLPKPAGQITGLYVIDRINPETGLEDPTASEDWCRKVYYQQVEFCAMEAYMRLCQRCGGAGIAAVTDAIASAFFGIYRIKRSYPRPTNEGLPAGLPPLPEGYVYPQSSTDARGRSPSGVWAVHRGRVYVSPWIQSTETVVIPWVGIKRNWAGSDLVEDDPKFRQAVRLHVLLQHEQSSGDDTALQQRLRFSLYGSPDEAGAIPLLIHDCNEQNRIKRCGEAGAAGMAGAAVGMGTNTQGSNLYYNDRQQFTASCPAGQTGTAVTVVVEAGTVGSALSVADANSRAIQQATAQAQDQLVCVPEVVTYFNTEQSYTANCPAATETTPGADGVPSTATISAGVYSSTVSQAAADAQALAAARVQAQGQLSCTFWNADQSYTASCISPATGADVTKTVPAHTFSSTVSQADANAQALASATQQANEALSCTVPPTVFYNVFVTAFANRVCPTRVVNGMLCVPVVNVTVNVSAGRFTSIVSQSAANQAALSYGQQYAQAAAQSACSFAPCEGSNPVYNV